jgi:hypothetical protein
MFIADGKEENKMVESDSGFIAVCRRYLYGILLP